MSVDIDKVYPAVANLFFDYDSTPGAEQCTLYKMFDYAWQPLTGGNPFEHIYVSYLEPYVDNSVLKNRKAYADIGCNTALLTELFYTTFFNRKFFRYINYNYEAGQYISANSYALELSKWFRDVYIKNSNKYINNIATLGFIYDPIFNYDMNETSGSWIKDSDLKVETTPSGSVTTEHDRTQYDNTNYVHESKDVTTYESGTKTTTDEKHQHLTNTTINKEDDIYNPSANRDNIDKLAGGKIRRYGNIGVTTTQQMIEQQRNIVRYSVINDYFNDLDKEVLLNIYE